MELGFDVNKLTDLKRPQLQKLCKKFGIKANSKTSQLIDDLKEFAQVKHSAEKTAEFLEGVHEKIKTPESNVSFDEERSDKKVEKDTCKSPQSLSYKQQLMQQLEEKVEETLKESKIPRLTNRNVTFTVGTTSTPPVTKKQSKTKEHPAFRKMDSIDVYLAKKKKRTMSLYANISKAEIVAKKARSIIADMKAAHNTPAKESPAKRIRRSTFEVNKNGNGNVPTSFNFGHLKSPKIVLKRCTSMHDKKAKPASSLRKSMPSEVKVKESKMPFSSRKSIAATPFRSNGVSNSSVSSKKKFDLQASLSKPLNYKPHKGKIEKFPLAAKESKIPVRVKKSVDLKADVRNVKVTTRVERRQNNRQNNADKRKNAVLARRGLVC